MEIIGADEWDAQSVNIAVKLSIDRRDLNLLVAVVCLGIDLDQIVLVVGPYTTMTPLSYADFTGWREGASYMRAAN